MGIKSGHPTHWAVLFVVERVAGSLELTTMLDFGPSALTDAVAQNASDTFQLPLPPPGAKPTAGQHGTGLTIVPNWNRVPNGLDSTGNPHVHEISLAMMLSGAFGPGGNALQVPAGPGAQLDLAELLRQFGI